MFISTEWIYGIKNIAEGADLMTWTDIHNLSEEADLIVSIQSNLVFLNNKK